MRSALPLGVVVALAGAMMLVQRGDDAPSTRSGAADVMGIGDAAEGPPNARSAGAAASSGCRLALTPPAVAPGAGRVPVHAVPTGRIGPARLVLVEETSQLVVVGAAAERPSGATRILLDAGRARTGEWRLELRGADGRCSGIIAVREGAGADRTERGLSPGDGGGAAGNPSGGAAVSDGAVPSGATAPTSGSARSPM